MSEPKVEQRHRRLAWDFCTDYEHGFEESCGWCDGLAAKFAEIERNAWNAGIDACIGEVRGMLKEEAQLLLERIRALEPAPAPEVK